MNAKENQTQQKKPAKVSNISLSANEKIGLVSNLATMLEAGIPILEAIDSVLEDSKGNLKKILLTMKEDVSSGKRMSSAMEKYPKVFDKITINIVKASEESGTLDVVLRDLQNNITKENEFNDKIRSALIYPAVILFVFSGVLMVILTFVIPKISQVFTRLNLDLPLPTQIMIATSDLILEFTIPTIIGVIVFVALSVFIYKKNKKLVINTFLSLPYISNLAREIDITRFSHSLYLLLNAGIPIAAALELTEDVVNKKEMQKAITHSKDMVKSGKKLSEGLKDHKKTVPSIMIKLVEAGERTGSLEKSMQETTKYFEYQVGKSLAAVTVLLEPIVLVATGLLIGGMMISIIAPIYGLIGQVGGR